MRKIGISLLLCLCLFLPMPVHAAEDGLHYDETLAGLLDACGIEALLETENIEPLLETAPERITDLSFHEILGTLWEAVLSSAKEPLRLLLLLIGVILLAALTDSLKSKGDTLAELCEILAVLCAVQIILPPITAMFTQATAILERSASFMLSFSIIFGAVLSVSGGLTAAVGYQSLMVAVCELAMQIAAHLLFPLLSMGLALAIVDAVNPMISLDGMVKLLHKVTVWILGFLMTIFLAMLSLQSMVSLSADRFSSRTTKFVIANAVPFVGNAVSDAYATVLGSMGILRSTTGVIGILSVLAILLPILLQLGIHRLLLLTAAAVSDLFAVQRLTKLLKHLETILAAAFSVAVSFSVMFIVSTALLLLLSSNLIPA